MIVFMVSDLFPSNIIFFASADCQLRENGQNRNRNGKVLGCRTRLNMGDFHHPRVHVFNIITDSDNKKIII